MSMLSSCHHQVYVILLSITGHNPEFSITVLTLKEPAPPCCFDLFFSVSHIIFQSPWIPRMAAVLNNRLTKGETVSRQQLLFHCCQSRVANPEKKPLNRSKGLDHARATPSLFYSFCVLAPG